MTKKVKTLVDSMNREELLAVIQRYYESINRTNPPKYETYSLRELRGVLNLFHITVHLVNDTS